MSRRLPVPQIEPELADPMDRKIARGIADRVLRDTEPDDEKASIRIAYAHELLERVRAAERQSR